MSRFIYIVFETFARSLLSFCPVASMVICWQRVYNRESNFPSLPIWLYIKLTGQEKPELACFSSIQHGSCRSQDAVHWFYCDGFWGEVLHAFCIQFCFSVTLQKCKQGKEHMHVSVQLHLCPQLVVLNELEG